MSRSESPNRYRELLAVAALALGAFVVSLNVTLFGPLLPFLVEDPMYAELGRERAQAALVVPLSAAGLAGAAAALLLGPWVDRVGRRLPMLVGCGLLAAGLAAHGWITGHGQLVALRVVSGFGGGLLFTSASAAVADLVPYERRAAAMGVFSAGMFLALPVGLPLANWIAGGDAEGWRWAFAALAIPAVIAAILLVVCLPARLGRTGSRVTQLEVARSPHVLAALLSVLLYTGAFFTAVQFAASWLDRSGIVPKENQQMIWVALGLLTAVGSVTLSRLADRFGKRNFVLITTAGVAVCLFALTRVDRVGGLWLVGVPLTLLASARTPALQALMSEIVEPRMRGTLMGLRAAAVNLGAGVFAGIGGVLNADHGYQAVLYMCAGAMLAAYLTVRWFVRVSL